MGRSVNSVSILRRLFWLVSEVNLMQKGELVASLDSRRALGYWLGRRVRVETVEGLANHVLLLTTSRVWVS